MKMSFSFLLSMLFLLLKLILLPELFFKVFSGEGNFFEASLLIVLESGESLIFLLMNFKEFIAANMCLNSSFYSCKI